MGEGGEGGSGGGEVWGGGWVVEEKVPSLVVLLLWIEMGCAASSNVVGKPLEGSRGELKSNPLCWWV